MQKKNNITCHLFLILGLIVFLPSVTYAADYSDGDPCTASGAFHQSNDAGGMDFLICDGSNWLSTLYFGSEGGLTISTLTGQPAPQYSSSSLNDLTDVDTTGVGDGECITYNNAAGEWQAGSCGGGGGTPAGANTQIQFNNSGAFGASANFAWDNASKTLGIKATSFGEAMAISLTQTNGGGNAVGMDFYNNNWGDLVAEFLAYDSSFSITTFSDAPLYFRTNDTDRMIITTGGDVGIGTATPSYLLSIDGNSAQTIGMERHTTADTAGNDLTIAAGGATSGSTNRDGGFVYIQGGTSTGQGGSGIVFRAANGGQGAGTTDRAPTDTYGVISGDNRSVRFGFGSTANGLYSMALGGYQPRAFGQRSVAIGSYVDVSGVGSMGIGLISGTPGTEPDVSGDRSLGIFMGDQSGVDVTASNVMAILGGNVGIGDANPSVALSVVGDIDYTGVITDVSDRRLKENITPLERSLEGILALNGYSFTMKDDESGAVEYGLIAQEVQPVFPALVKTKPDGLMTLNYMGLFAPLIEATKAQQAEIEELRAANAALEERLNKLESRYGTEE